MGLEQPKPVLEFFHTTKSPSHTVGLEHEAGIPLHTEIVVAIPHGGLRTRDEASDFVLCYVSPSHTVGLEQGETGGLKVLPQASPSHTVGLEHIYTYHLWAGTLSPSRAAGLERNNRVAITLSPGDKLVVFQLLPSHTVGLEHPRISLQRLCQRVSIPHGGLRTIVKEEEAIRHIISVSIPHGGLRTQRS